MSDTPNNDNEVNEPGLNYQPMKKTLTFFKSLDDQKDYQLKLMAEQTPFESMRKMESLRRLFLKNFLQDDGNWPPLKRLFKMKKPFE
jgi:hypothetical protein